MNYIQFMKNYHRRRSPQTQSKPRMTRKTLSIINTTVTVTVTGKRKRKRKKMMTRKMKTTTMNKMTN